MRTIEPLDHSHQLADLIPKLDRLETAVHAGDKEAIFRVVAEVDWRLVSDEFELVVAQHCLAVDAYARRMIHNLLRPYMLRRDCNVLERWLAMLDSALDESPSLRDTADAEVAKAWQEELDEAHVRQREIRALAPVASLGMLRVAAADKLSLGRILESKDAQYAAGARVPYPLDWEPRDRSNLPADGRDAPGVANFRPTRPSA